MANDVLKLADECEESAQAWANEVDTRKRAAAALRQQELALAELRAEVERYKAIATGVRSYLTDALAMALAEDDGHEGDDKHRLIWSGGAAPEPEGEIWQRYLGKAGVIAEKALASVADWSAAEDAYYTELRDECIEQTRIDKQRADTAEARLERARGLLSQFHALVWGECPSLLNEDSAGDGVLDIDIRAFLGESK